MSGNRILWINAGFSPDVCLPESWRSSCRTPDSAIQELKARSFDAVVLDFPLPLWSPPRLLEKVKQVAPDIPVVVRDPEMTPSAAVHLARGGAYQVLGPNEDISPVLQQALDECRRLHPNVPEDWEAQFVGASSGMRRVRQIIRMVACRRSTVLITGETGTGKELAARALHLAGPRREGPWVAVNCSALPETLLEAELFGHVRGAFTGAMQSRVGRFEQAHGGTLFLDEIGELPLELQAKLLRVLQQREFERLGSSETVRVDIRLIAATNCHLEQKIVEGKFRDDLYYRLNVVPLEIPPLRRRREDIPILAGHFLKQFSELESLPEKELDGAALHFLMGYSWPGNVRQLENAMEMAIALSGDRGILTAADFPLSAPRAAIGSEEEMPLLSVPDAGLDYERTLAGIERNILGQALAKTGGNKKAAAELLGLKRTTLSAKVRTLEAALRPN
jgi:DNA-binding NtrC family response regulator